MARKIKSNKPKWITFPDDPEIQFNVKPFSFVHLKVMPSGDIEPKFMADVFVMSVVDWKGILGADDKELKCDDTNKMEIAKQNIDLVSFVCAEVFPKEKDNDKTKELKN